MNILNNVKIKNKLIILVFVPLLTILIMASLVIKDHISLKSNYENLEVIVNLNITISKLIHETQKERGLTAGFLGTNGQKFKNEIPGQRENTNKKIQILKEFLKSSNAKELLKKNTFNYFKIAMIQLDNINNIRNQVDTLRISSTNAIDYYTKMNCLFINFIAKTSQLSSDPELTYGILSYANFLQSKERSGIERAVASTTFANDKFKKGTKSKLESIISEQNSYMKSYFTLASEDIKEFTNKILKDESIHEVNRMRNILIRSKEIGGFGIDAAYWFNTISEKIKLYKKIEDYIREHLNIKNKKLKKNIKIAININNLLDEIQKERGLTSGFLGSQGKKFSKELSLQRILTNQKLIILRQSIKRITTKNLNKLAQNNLIKVFTLLKKLQIIRMQIDNLNINTKVAINYYTKLNTIFLNIISNISIDATTASEARNLLAWHNFIMAKERAGIERAIMTNSFARNKFLPGMKEEFTKLIAEQNSYINSFLHSATPNMVKFYFKAISSKYIDEVNRMRNIAIKANTIGGFGVDATYWFNTISKKIDLLKKVDDYLSKTLVKKAEYKLDKETKSLYTYSFLIFLNIFVTAILAYYISKNLANSIEKISGGIEQFLSFLARDHNVIEKVDLHSADELGIVAKMINDNIDKINDDIENDMLCVGEAILTLNKMQQGYYNCRVNTNASNSQIQTLATTINKMLDVQSDIMQNILLGLRKYTHYNYIDKIILDEDIDGVTKELVDGINNLGDAITKMLVDNKRNGLTLDESSDILLDNVEILNNKIKTNAIALEKTTVALQEITSNTTKNNNSIIQMAGFASQVTNSVSQGEKLANQTTTAMDDINNEVMSINEAISIIDQIAFQTNILSLNAAVEAATAGEAGKGFAVVAQEVRNLASKSAEAANDIKSLVEKASSKANKGKHISDLMIDGYNELNTNITKTIDLISNIEESSKKQEQGIVQINSAITQLDSQTREMAEISTQSYSVAEKTDIIAKIIVVSAEEKEFIGKQDIIGDDLSTI
jgi:methyl-accepting chemotaxis protein